MVVGLAGPELTARERAWFTARPPLGVMLFARNIRSPEQVRRLLADAREAAGRELWAAIDEEGGRVSRMPWPPFAGRKPAAEYGAWFRRDPEQATQAVWRDSREVGQALAELGFTHNCAPVLDVFHPGGHAVIGERAWADDPAVVAGLGLACARGLAEAGIAAVGKHFPGHGRADADSHRAVPAVGAPLETVLAEAEPFRRLIAGESGVRLAHVMTAHVRYDCSNDGEVATMSRFWLGEVLRKRFGFAGTVWSDDLCMAGAGGSAPAGIPEAAAKAVAAGCDVLLVCEPAGVEAAYRAWLEAA